jgi:alpha-mannosidase
LTDKPRTHQQFSIAIQAYSGRKKEQNVFRRADLAVLNPTARTLYSGLTLLKDLERFYGAGTQESKEIRELIRRTLVYLKYFKPEGEEYPNAIGRALRFLTQTMEAELRTEVPGLIHLIGHSHLDVVWLWTMREARRKSGRTFSTMLRLMDEFPGFRYSQSQPILYEFVKKDYPDLYKEVKQRVLEGRWEPLGAMWLEPDCNIPNGESLVRHILQGKKFFRSEFGLDPNILWLPDSFGFNAALPQIMKKSGIQYFFTTKLTWNDTTKFPFNTFWWKGIDGSKVLAHIPPVGLEGQIMAKDLKKSWEEFQQKEDQTDVLQTYGYGDGGGGPSKDHYLAIDFLKNLPSLPPLRIGSAREFFAAIDEKSKALPTWESELYLEKHRGTYTTHGWVKKENRECEALLYNAELLSTIATLHGKRYPAGDLEAAWKLLLTNQFHDILPGTSVADVYEDVRKTYARLRKITATLTGNALAGFCKPAKKSSKEFHFTLFNPLPWERNEYLEFTVRSGEKRFTVRDSMGRTVEHQVTGRAKGSVALLCYVEAIPPCSSLTINITSSADKADAPESWKVSTRVIETPVYRLRVDTQGHLTSLHSKPLRRELLKKGSRHSEIQEHTDPRTRPTAAYARGCPPNRPRIENNATDPVLPSVPANRLQDKRSLVRFADSPQSRFSGESQSGPCDLRNSFRDYRTFGKTKDSRRQGKVRGAGTTMGRSLRLEIRSQSSQRQQVRIRCQRRHAPSHASPLPSVPASCRAMASRRCTGNGSRGP